MDEISNIKFNLTPVMADKIIIINEIKVKLYEIEQKINSVKEDEKINLLKEKEELMKQMDNQKKEFIKEFQNNNKEQISEYLKFKNNN